MTDLRLEGPHPHPINGEEAALGVVAKLSYVVDAGAYRLSQNGNDRGPWQTGVPAALSRLDLILRGEVWSAHVDCSPLIPEASSD